MKIHVRILLAAAALALAAGYVGLRQGNAALAARLTSAGATGAGPDGAAGGSR